MLRKLSVAAVFCALSVAALSTPVQKASGVESGINVEAMSTVATLTSAEENPAPRLPGPIVTNQMTSRIAQIASEEEQARIAAEQLAAEQAAEQVRAARIKAQRVAVVSNIVTGEPADWMREAGIAESDMGYVDYIIGKESGWGYSKWNYAGSGAYGLGQALPASKMARFGDDYMTNPVTQLRWANSYAVNRYGSWENSYVKWNEKHWW